MSRPLIKCIFIGGPLHGEKAWLDSVDKLMWRPLSQGHVAAYGLRERNDESTSAFYAPVGFSDYQYRECLDEFLGRGS